MPATVSSFVFANPGVSTSITFAGVTVGSGQTVFVTLTSRDNTGANYASATWNGSAATVSESFNGTLVDGLQAHRLVFRSLVAATASLVITLDATQDDLAGWAVVITDANQTTTMGAAGTATYPTGSGGQTGGTVSTAAASTDLVFNTLRNRAGTASTQDAGQTLVGTNQTTANGNVVGLSYEAGTGGTSVTGWTFTNPGFSPWAMDAVVIQGTGGGGSGSGILVGGTLVGGSLIGVLA